MGEDRLNALLLLYVHRDIKLDYDKIIDDYARILLVTFKLYYTS